MIATQELIASQPCLPTCPPLHRPAKLGAAHRPLDFDLPQALEAGQPPEARGLARDEVRLMVSYLSTDSFYHGRFLDLPQYLTAGDLVVVNTSGTLPAALPAQMAGHVSLELHLSTHLPDGSWTVELRQLAGNKSKPFLAARPGHVVQLPGGARARLLWPYHETEAGVRLWVARLWVPGPLETYLLRYGFPIRYHYVSEPWPLAYYQTVYATEMGCAEMPSAGRAFSKRVLAGLSRRGVRLASLILHTGVASLEDHEPPYEEYYRLPVATAGLVNEALADGRRVIAVGTTVVRALETMTDDKGLVQPGEGWTDLVITPERGLRAVNGLLTGFHEPKASHLFMLEALAGRAHLALAYQQALQQGYLWHEFGDLQLILP